MAIKLEHVRAGNAVLVKLVDQENLAAEVERYQHDFEDKRTHPSISVSHVIFKGNQIVLPGGRAQLLAWGACVSSWRRQPKPARMWVWG